jgi:Transposase domain (DUF772)
VEAQAEDAIYDSESMRRFARVELGDDVVPDESTILRFRHLLEKHGLTKGIFEIALGQEPGSSPDDVCAGESVPGPKLPAPRRSEVCSVKPMTREQSTRGYQRAANNGFSNRELRKVVQVRDAEEA